MGNLWEIWGHNTDYKSMKMVTMPTKSSQWIERISGMFLGHNGTLVSFVTFRPLSSTVEHLSYKSYQHPA
jgi:hypothetical protein